jgi:hypothetical protein
MSASGWRKRLEFMIGGKIHSKMPVDAVEKVEPENKPSHP